ncbi:MAG: diguanylate cyclase [Lachnospiraceae bacterium]|nr:diguanylate cyclase [Lachnospiraceae bacterium]
MKTNEKKLSYIKRLYGVIMFLMAITALTLGFSLVDDWYAPPANHTIDLDDGWTRINADGSEEAVSGRFSIGKTEAVTFYRTLPEHLNMGEILRIKCPYETVDAYIDGELIYHAGPANFGYITTTLGNVFALIPLEEDYANKEIRITVKPRNYGFEVLVKDAAITNMSSYFLVRMCEGLPYFCLCLVMAIISLISAVLFVVFKLSGEYKSSAKGFLALSVFGTVAAAWIVSDYHIIGMLTGRMALSGLINYLAFMLCPVAFAWVLLNAFDNNKFFLLMYYVCGTNFIVQMLLFFFGAMDLPKGLMVSQCLTIFIVIGLIYFGFLKMKAFSSENPALLGLPTACFIGFSVIAAVSYIKNGEWMLFVALAMTFYVFTVISSLLTNLWKVLSNNIELQQVKKIAYVDNLTQLENRRAYDECIADYDSESKDNLAGLTAIMLDVNGLKKTNDIYGHVAGDELIIGSAECMKKTFMDVGRIFRTGGDEFAVIGHMDEDTYKKNVKLLETALSNWTGEYIKGISVSVGMATKEEFPDSSLEKLLAQADKRMYEHKQHYYAEQLAIADEKNGLSDDTKSTRKFRYADNFALTKYTMPIIRQMAEVIPGGFFIYQEDDKREIIYQNRKVLDIYGCDSVEEFKKLTGYTFEGMVYHEDFEKIQNSIDKQIDDEEGDGMDHVIYRIIRKDGEIRWVDDYGHFSHSDDYGDIYYVFISDITDRIKKENS